MTQRSWLRGPGQLTVSGLGYLMIVRAGDGWAGILNKEIILGG